MTSRINTKLYILLGFATIAVVGAVVYILLRPTSSPLSQTPPLASLEQLVPETTDVQAPSIASITADAQTADDRYSSFMLYGELKAHYQKYPEAQSYFEAALEVVAPSDSQKLADTRYRLYLLGVSAGDTGLQQRYIDLLGSELIDSKKRQETERVNNL